MSERKWRVIVCGSRFGRVYMAGTARLQSCELAGVLGTGSERSRECAQRYSVPLYTRVEALPSDIDGACVIVGSGLAGGAGSAIARMLLERKIYVLQEHPIHPNELAGLIRVAYQNGVVHQVSTLYPYTRVVGEFISLSRRIVSRHPPLYVDGACSLQLQTSFFDVLGRILGRLRPWEFESLPLRRPRSERQAVFRSLQGSVAGVSVSVRIQNELHAADPDNHCHLYHQMTVGTAAGSLCLVDTHGPIVWRPRPHIPIRIQAGGDPALLSDEVLNLEATTLVQSEAQTWRSIMTTGWPTAAGAAVGELQARASGQIWPDAQYYLSLAQMMVDVSAELGAPEIIHHDAPVPESLARVTS